MVLQLRDKLPQFSDRFSTQLDIFSLSSVGTTATLATPTPHGLSVNEDFNINGITVDASIVSIENNLGVATITTVENHDLTLNYQENVTISGANESQLNGTFELTGVKNRKIFTLKTDVQANISGTGTMIAVDVVSNIYSGIHVVSNVISNTVINFELQYPTNALEVKSGNLSKNSRIVKSLDFQRCVDSYTSRDIEEDYIFVTLGNVIASKDRNINSDAIYISNTGVDYKQQLIQPFSVFYFANVTDEISGANSRDYVEGALVKQIFNSLVGKKFDSGLSAKAYYQTVFTSHGVQLYNGAIYAHIFNFETIVEINANDTIGEEFNVAFRDIDLNIKTDLMTDDTQLLSGNINLDDEPLP